MPGKIFVNYRRDDVPDGAARLRDGLAAKFGRTSIFMDVDNLLAGQRFDQELAKALDACDVLIAVIGARWMEQLAGRVDTGERDYVREEIGAALKRGIVVIPVRVGRDGQMPPLPRPDELPDDIRDLVHYQKHDVAHERFARDVDDLAAAIRTVRIAERRPKSRAALTGWALAGVVGLLAAGGLGAYYAGLPFPGLTTSGGSDTLKAAAIADEKARVERENKRLAALEAENKRLAAAAAKAQRDLEARQKAEAEAKRKAEEADRKRLAALKAEEAKRKAEAEARRRDPALSVQAGSGKGFRDCADGCPEMVVVPAGTFMMGEGSSQRRTSIARSFAVGKFEVTFAEWEACVAGRGCASNKSPSDQGWGKGRRPVINVSWNHAKEYVSWISRKTGKTYRLLTTAEWEYAARAGTTTSYSWGDAIGRGNANCDGCGSQWDNKQTAPVGSFKPNDFGLHDMHGNVWEWCEDIYDTSVSSRVLRGGSWSNDPNDLRSADRNSSQPDNRFNFFGFRVARTL